MQTDRETAPITAQETETGTEAPPPDVEELERDWAALSCDCTGDFL